MELWTIVAVLVVVCLVLFFIYWVATAIIRKKQNITTPRSKQFMRAKNLFFVFLILSIIYWIGVSSNS
ncbi:hypothetical protein BKH43_05465 [Helicobacter sp. 13S00401-1]|uniref:hypothetical protein n=1 Tax=Helicobacter sp. 13S00401-1 TaxID=1905758 RepID=UPI000BA5ED8E|nr:hypothetical protein [Helicobacter sp. 13S00401-1]PAF50187.1 hypothetical protein BKH43_05465 [Helicobacter sp. 13S00401-1]